MNIQFEVKKSDVLRAYALLGNVDERTIELVNKYENDTFVVEDSDIADGDDATQMMLAFAYLIASKISKAEHL